jgi:hypothetical protein
VQATSIWEPQVLIPGNRQNILLPTWKLMWRKQTMQLCVDGSHDSYYSLTLSSALPLSSVFCLFSLLFSTHIYTQHNATHLLLLSRHRFLHFCGCLTCGSAAYSWRHGASVAVPLRARHEPTTQPPNSALNRDDGASGRVLAKVQTGGPCSRAPRPLEERTNLIPR